MNSFLILLKPMASPALLPTAHISGILIPSLVELDRFLIPIDNSSLPHLRAYLFLLMLCYEKKANSHQTGSQCFNILTFSNFLSNFKITERHSFPADSQGKQEPNLFQAQIQQVNVHGKFVFCILYYFLQLVSVSPKNGKYTIHGPVGIYSSIFGQILEVKYLVSKDRGLEKLDVTRNLPAFWTSCMIHLLLASCSKCLCIHTENRVVFRIFSQCKCWAIFVL